MTVGAVHACVCVHTPTPPHTHPEEGRRVCGHYVKGVSHLQNSATEFPEPRPSLNKRHRTWGHKKMDQGKVLATKPDKLSSVPRNHTVKEENQLPKVVF